MLMDSIENQDRGTEVAAFVDGERHRAPVRAGDDIVTWAARNRVAWQRVEILKACVDHPNSPAVDCLICVPL